MSKEAVRESFVAYRAAVLAEEAARDAHTKKQTSENHRALVEAIGAKCAARTGLDATILTAHGLTASKT